MSGLMMTTLTSLMFGLSGLSSPFRVTSRRPGTAQLRGMGRKKNDFDKPEKRDRSMKRPELKTVSLDETMRAICGGLKIDGKPICFVTMSVGQWDALLQAAYDSGFTLLELDRREKPIRAYRKEMDS